MKMKTPNELFNKKIKSAVIYIFFSTCGPNPRLADGHPGAKRVFQPSLPPARRGRLGPCLGLAPSWNIHVLICECVFLICLLRFTPQPNKLPSCQEPRPQVEPRGAARSSCSVQVRLNEQGLGSRVASCNWLHTHCLSCDPQEPGELCWPADSRR